MNFAFVTGAERERKWSFKRSKNPKKMTAGLSVYFLPVPLKEPVSGGLKVDFRFCPYSKRLNRRIVFLGLTSLLLVEISIGEGVISYHNSAIVLIPIYFIAVVLALYVEYEKQKFSVWPQSSING